MFRAYASAGGLAAVVCLAFACRADAPEPEPVSGAGEPEGAASKVTAAASPALPPSAGRAAVSPVPNVPLSEARSIALPERAGGRVLKLRAPAAWSVRDGDGELAGWELPRLRTDEPAFCQVVAVTPEGTDLDEVAEAEARRVRIKTPEGRSVRRDLEVADRSFSGTLTWKVALTHGTYHPARELQELDTPGPSWPDHAQLNAVPRVAGVPFAVRCIAPAATLAAERPGIEAMLATAEL